MNASNAISSYPHARLNDWSPDFPAGRIDRLYLHWSAHGYRDVFPAYHFCIAKDADDEIVVVQTNALEVNMRDVRQDPDRPSAAHTRGRNSFALGVAIMGMAGASPQDFGPYPLTQALIEGLAVVCARLVRFYSIALDPGHVLTHAEAAVADGYFGTAPDERWDIARLAAAPHALEPLEALRAGNRLRDEITAAMTPKLHPGSV
ncbi:MAG: hypothetical protein NVS9B12_00610 [Vulcanimicrobiaceae bacterium]